MFLPVILLGVVLGPEVITGLLITALAMAIIFGLFYAVVWIIEQMESAGTA